MASLVRRRHLDFQEVVILAVEATENLLELNILVCLVEEVIELRNENDDDEAQDDLYVVFLHKQENVKDALQHNDDYGLSKGSEECQVCPFKLPWVVQCVLHVGEGLLKLIQLVDVEYKPTDESQVNDGCPL